MAVVVKMNNEGAQALLKSYATQDLLKSHAKEVAAKAKLSSIDTKVKVGKRRSWVRVETADQKAAHQNSKNNGLLSALATRTVSGKAIKPQKGAF